MTDTLVDSNVLIDILKVDPSWNEWSRSQLKRSRKLGKLVINQLIYAEIAAGYSSPRDVDRALNQAIYRRENLPWDAAFRAGEAYVGYRRARGLKGAPLPDFYIGAHAELAGYTLLTRDASVYRTYFPSISLVTPETDP